MKKQGFALVFQDGDKYQMSTVHKTAECAITNGISIFSGSRVVAIVPVDFEDDGEKNIHLCFGDEELRLKAIADAEEKAAANRTVIDANRPGRLYTADSYASTTPDK